MTKNMLLSRRKQISCTGLSPLMVRALFSSGKKKLWSLKETGQYDLFGDQGIRI
jgi:hypothetical protein